MKENAKRSYKPALLARDTSLNGIYAARIERYVPKNLRDNFNQLFS